MKKKFAFIILCLLGFSAMAQTKFKINDYPISNSCRILSRDSADIIFNLVKSSPIFEFNYTRGGCDYRAHAAYLLMKKMGYTSFKIWNFASSKIFLAGKDFNTHNLLLSVKDKLSLSTKSEYYSNCNINIDESVYWGYHVAPVILVKGANKVDTLIVDPALYDKLVDYKDWVSVQLQVKASSYFTFLDGNLISFQTESQYQKNGIYCRDCSGNNILTGVFWTDEYSIQQKWVEQSLSKGRIFVEYYKNEIHPLERELLKYPTNTSDLNAKKLACEIALKKQNIADESGLNKLPQQYQSKFSKYVEQATKILFN